MFKLVIVAAILPAAAWRWTTHFAQAAISEPGAYAFYHPGDLPPASYLSEIGRLSRGQITRVS
jgi:hypothetical protein